MRLALAENTKVLDMSLPSFTEGNLDDRRWTPNIEMVLIERSGTIADCVLPHPSVRESPACDVGHSEMGVGHIPLDGTESTDHECRLWQPVCLPSNANFSSVADICLIFDFGFFCEFIRNIG